MDEKVEPLDLRRAISLTIVLVRPLPPETSMLTPMRRGPLFDWKKKSNDTKPAHRGPNIELFGGGGVARSRAWHVRTLLYERSLHRSTLSPIYRQPLRFSRSPTGRL